MDYDRINDAIVNYMSILCTDESIKNIEDKFGPETWATIHRITTDVVNNMASVQLDDYLEDEDLRTHHIALIWMKNKYPFLSHAAMIKLADTSAYFWKST